MTTDSESENEAAKANGRVITQFRWTPSFEEKLEDMLTQNMFDFHKTAKDFSALVNKDDKKWY